MILNELCSLFMTNDSDLICCVNAKLFSGFKFDFSNNRVTISNSDVSKSSDRAVYYPYASNNFYSNDLVELDGPNTIFLSFDGNSFSNSDSERRECN